ncbi:hypothetical protein ACHAWX_002871 [Stephanocyclus meneghinianus]
MANTPQDKEATASSPTSNGDSSQTRSSNSIHQVPSKSLPKSTLLAFAAAVALGILLGGFVVSRLLDSEYQQIIAKLRINHQTSLTRFKEDRRACHEERETEKQRATNALIAAQEASFCDEEVKACRSQSTDNERIYRQELEDQILSANNVLEDANAGLEKASQKLKRLREEYQRTETELGRKKAELDGTARKYHETVNHLQDSKAQLERVQNKLSSTERQLVNAERELEAAGREFDRRDVERAECDKTHRDMVSCQRMLNESLGGLGKDDLCSSTIQQLNKDKADLSQELSAARNEREKASEEITFLQQQRAHLEEQISGFSTLAGEHERERDELREQIVMVYEKIQVRDRQLVLDRYGPGPHHVEVVIQLPTEIPTQESLVLELGPLDIMPHTIKTFLEMIEHHIILVGPSDAHDAENNQRLTERMLQQGYHPNGALIFKEYSDEYPHVQGTVGFTGGRSGPIFYVNLMNNAENHGALRDPCFAKFIRGFDLLERIAQMPKDEDGRFEWPIYIVRAEILTD